MNLSESFRMAWRSIKSNRMRSSLTMLGVIIGIAAVITMVSMGEGAKGFIIQQIQGFGMGATTVAIHPGVRHSPSGMLDANITLEDVRIVERHPNVKAVAPFIMKPGDVKFAGKRHETEFIFGTAASYPTLVNSPVAQGRFFSETEDLARRKVCVLGSTLAQALFGSFPPEGERVKINGVNFTVLGVMQKKGSLASFDFDDCVIIPATAAMDLFQTKRILEIVFSVADEATMYSTIRDVEANMFQAHKKINFHFHTQEEMMSVVSNVIGALTFVIGGIAMISLLVGGIGVMNIMLVSVTERTREVGIRKAVGARTKDIFNQFLMEAVLITVLGGVGGILLGCLLSFAILRVMGVGFVLAWWSVMLATVVSGVIGLFFGVYPARRAARMDPIEALRYE